MRHENANGMDRQRQVTREGQIMVQKRIGRDGLDENPRGLGLGDSQLTRKMMRTDTRIVHETDGISNLALQIGIELGSEVRS